MTNQPVGFGAGGDLLRRPAEGIDPGGSRIRVIALFERSGTAWSGCRSPLFVRAPAGGDGGGAHAYLRCSAEAKISRRRASTGLPTPRPTGISWSKTIGQGTAGDGWRCVAYDQRAPGPRGGHVDPR